MASTLSSNVVLGAPLPNIVPCTADGLNASFARPGAVHFECHEALGTLVRVSAPGGSALISLYGAQVLEWTPASAPSNCLWVSDEVFWSRSRPVRGGIPICWPWFGPNTRYPEAPSHGVARTAVWQVYTTCATATEARICLKMINPAQYDAAVPHGAEVMAEIVITDALQVSVTTINTGDQAFDITQALHTYLRVGDIGKVRITGLERAPYFDQVAIASRPAARQPLVIDRETDRVYRDVTGTVTVEDTAVGRAYRIDKTGSTSTVVWNPWQATSAAMPDMANDDYRTMVCVETANAGGDVVQLKPGEIHKLLQTLSAH